MKRFSLYAHSLAMCEIWRITKALIHKVQAYAPYGVQWYKSCKSSLAMIILINHMFSCVNNVITMMVGRRIAALIMI